MLTSGFFGLWCLSGWVRLHNLEHMDEWGCTGPRACLGPEGMGGAQSWVEFWSDWQRFHIFQLSWRRKRKKTRFWREKTFLVCETAFTFETWNDLMLLLLLTSSLVSSWMYKTDVFNCGVLQPVNLCFQLSTYLSREHVNKEFEVSWISKVIWCSSSVKRNKIVSKKKAINDISLANCST